MSIHSRTLAAILLQLLLVSNFAVADDAAKDQKKRQAPLLEGMGDSHHPITTENKLAQRYFDQGLVLAYGFNHAEAERSFLEAARLDPKCAMAWWGSALVVGPNINAPMSDDAVPKAWKYLQSAQDLAKHASQQEQDYIEALSARYVEKPVKDRSSLDAAYAEAMRKLVRKYPDDTDAAALLAESLMDMHPWDYWTKDGEPKPWTAEIIKTLESALKKSPRHPLLNHLYIHAVEASSNPERGIPSADRLRFLVPGAGHLVHMPAHIYVRVGMYNASSAANQRAIKSDNEYVTQCHAQGMYPVAYMPHNEHFLWFSATFEGRSKLSINAAKHMAHHVDKQLMRKPGYGTLQQYYVTPVYALVRFGKWKEILELKAPKEDLLYPAGVWRFARGMAYARTKRLKQAKAELKHVTTIAADPALKDISIWGNNKMSELMAIAREVLSGELAAVNNKFDVAIQHLTEAYDLEQKLKYDEPESWPEPVLLRLGAVLLEAGRPAEAEAAFRRDLLRHPDNPWSLFGLAQALRAQDKNAEAAETQRRFEIGWSRSDVKLNGARF